MKKSITIALLLLLPCALFASEKGLLLLVKQTAWENHSNEVYKLNNYLMTCLAAGKASAAIEPNWLLEDKDTGDVWGIAFMETSAKQLKSSLDTAKIQQKIDQFPPAVQEKFLLKFTTNIVEDVKSKNLRQR